MIGPNGAGKTTVFNLITGIYQPDSGTVVFDGRSLVGLRPHAIAAAGIARTFQTIRLFPNLTVLENVMAGRHCRSQAGVVGALFRTRTQRARRAGHPRPGRAAPALHEHLAVPQRAGARTCPTATSAGWRSRARWPPIPSC